ncbi:MAG: RidA family protein [Saccharofermentanales bacterium]|jgi:2-iminobutanoate/2-iminopropanoate deaminase
MKRKIIATEKAPAAVGAYSQGMKVGKFVFTSGQLPIDPNTGEMPETIEEQTAQSMRNVSAILEDAGSSLDQAIKLTVFLQDINDFAAMNEVYASFFTGDAPCRSAIEVGAVPKGAKVEIEAIALISE